MAGQSLPEKIREISELDNDFHDAGVLGKEVVQAMYEFSRRMRIRHSAETGCGKSTLLFSLISENHQCFTLDDHASGNGGSLQAVTASPLFNKEKVEFILGPSQLTLPCHSFPDKLQLAFIDGPHGFPFPCLEYYYLYPHLEEGALLILDDIHIPSIAFLDQFLREDEMFSHLKTLANTSFFRRTAAPLFDPCGDGWWLQNYNKKRFTGGHNAKALVYHYLSKFFGQGFADRLRRYYRRLLAKETS